MGQTPPPKFSCSACGRRYTWKPALAGKAAKCACGQVLIVPSTAPEEESTDPLYELAASANAAIESRPSAPPRAAIGPVMAPVNPLAYQRTSAAEARQGNRFAYDSLTDPVRDIYIPVTLLVVGFVGAFGWALIQFHGRTTGLLWVSFILGLTTAIKTVIVVILAISLAPKIGISFGTLWSGVLKFAAILIFTDCALLWLDMILHATGAISSTGRATRGVLWIHLLVATAIISAASYYVFNMDTEETAKFALPMAIVSRGIDLVVYMILLGIVHSMRASAAARAPAPIPQPAPSPPSVIVSPSAPAAQQQPQQPAIVPTQLDNQITLRIQKRSLFVQEAREAKLHQIIPDRLTNQLAEAMYNAGALKVYVDREGSPTLSALRAYVELPPDPTARAACIEVAHRYRQDNNLPEAADPTDTQQFLLINLVPPRPRKTLK